MWLFKSNDQLDEIVRQRWKGQWVWRELYTQDAEGPNAARRTAKYLCSLVKNLNFPVLISYRKPVRHTDRLWDGVVRFAWPSSQDIGIDYDDYNFVKNLRERGFVQAHISSIYSTENFDQLLKVAFTEGVIRCNFKK